MKFKQKILDLNFKDRRELLKKLFTGKDVDKKKYGVYLDRLSNGDIVYTCYGNLTLGYFALGEIKKKSNKISNVNCSEAKKHRDAHTHKTGRQTG